MPSDDPNDLTVENLRALIATMTEWSMRNSGHWTEAQIAAWRLKWFKRTPEQDAAAREAYREERMSELLRGFDRYERDERGGFDGWPNGQGESD